jgi:hypothetical protein
VYRIFVGGASAAAVDFARGIGGFWGNQSDFESFFVAGRGGMPDGDGCGMELVDGKRRILF